MEALEIFMPSNKLISMFSGGEIDREDTFDKEYGQYFTKAMYK